MPKFKSAEDAELAQKLGFTPPKNIMHVPESKTTNVVGFFNGNTWPVHIAISALNVYVNLANRGDFVVDSDGNKINDPILEQFVGPGQLSKEVSKVPVPRRLFARPETRVGGETQVIHQVDRLVQTPGGMAPVILDPTKEPVEIPASTNPVVGMSMAQAIKLKLIRPSIVPDVRAPKDTDGNPLDSKDLPSLEDATPRDMKPGEYKRYLQELNARKASKAPKAAKVVTASPQESHEHEPEDEAPSPEIPAAAVVESEEQKALQQKLVDAASDKTIIQDAVAAAIGGGTKITQAPVLDTAAGVMHNLPKPNLSTAPEASQPTAPAQRINKFVCLVDGKVFDFRSQLEAHAKRKYPERVDEIMAAYPRMAGRPRPS